jgi:hypothetical protein
LLFLIALLLTIRAPDEISSFHWLMPATNCDGVSDIALIMHT